MPGKVTSNANTCLKVLALPALLSRLLAESLKKFRGVFVKFKMTVNLSSLGSHDLGGECQHEYCIHSHEKSIGNPCSTSKTQTLKQEQILHYKCPTRCSMHHLPGKEGKWITRCARNINPQAETCLFWKDSAGLSYCSSRICIKMPSPHQKCGNTLTLKKLQWPITMLISKHAKHTNSSLGN